MSAEGNSGWFTCRQILSIMVIFGFMLNYALRVNLTIAIVEMMEPTTLTADSNSTIPTTTESLETSTLASANQDNTVRFKWTESDKQLILGSFFWGYIMTELPGGRLAELIGGHRVFGHSMLWSSVVTLIIPMCANMGVTVMVISRVVLGFLLGASWPAIHPMCAVWIPPMERSKFLSGMMASALGAAVTMPICGFIISYINWQSTFYVTGGIGILWSLCWFLFIFETPAKHPRISNEEKRYIEDSIGSSTSKKRPSYVPWLSIVTSPAVWAIVIVHGCSVFGYFLVVNQLPTYMKTVLHFDIKSNGLFSSLPYLGKYCMSVVASYFADYLRSTGKVTTTVARKGFTAFAVAPPGIMFTLLIFFGYHKVWAVAIFTIALTLNGAVTAGYLGNGLDIAPNFSGTIFGMANTLSSAGGFLSAMMVAHLTDQVPEEELYGKWQIIFGIVAFSYIFGAAAFVIFGRGELQPWNNPPEKNGVQMQEINKTEEGIPLKSNNAS